MRISIKSLILLYLHLLFAQVSPAQMQTHLNNLVNDSRLQSATVSFCMVDLKTGDMLLQHNAMKAMIPASLMKISTTIAALEVLGSDHQFATKIYTSGVLKDGNLLGDLIIVGGGDPTLGSTYFRENSKKTEVSISEALNQRGVKRITGNVWVDERFFSNDVPATWSWEDIANYYASPARSLNYTDNTVELIYKTGAKGTLAELISTQPYVPNLLIESEVLAAEISADHAYCFAAPDDYKMVVKGFLPANRTQFTVKAALPEPGLFFGQLVVKSFLQAGIEFNGSVVKLEKDEQIKISEKTLVHRELSPSVKQIVILTNRNSINLFAETLAKQVSNSLEPDDSDPVEQINKFWKNKLSSPVGLNIKDGSGLSHYNTLTAAQICEMLIYANKASYAGDFKSSLPAAGKEGTLKNFGKGTLLENNLVAKSGYMTGSRGYAGYMKLKSGRTVALAIMVNNYSVSAGEMRKLLESFLVKLAEEELK